MMRLAVLAALVAGCSIFDTSGVGSGGTSVGESTTDGDSGVDATSHADDTSTTTSGSPVDGSTTTDSTTSTTSAETETSSSSSSSSSGRDSTDTTSGGTSGPPYPDCVDEDECADASHDCLQVQTRAMVVADFCAPPCIADDDECPAAATGDALPLCMNGTCRLSCEGGESCPDGMECFNVVGGSICAYPVD